MDKWPGRKGESAMPQKEFPVKVSRRFAALLLVTNVSWTCGGGESEKLLFCGFEKDELSKHFKVHKDCGDKLDLILPGDRGRVAYTFQKGVSTQGDWSFVMSIGEAKLLEHQTHKESGGPGFKSLVGWEAMHG